MIYKAIKYILENDSDFATAIGTTNGDYKIFPIMPRIKVGVPFCVFNITDQRGNPTKDSKSQMDEVRVKVSVFADDLEQTIDLAEKARIAMDAEKAGGTYNGIVINSIDFDKMNDDFAEGYGDRGAIVMEMDYIIWSEP